MKVLVTGFEPFGGDSLNPTEKIIGSLANEKLEGVSLVTKVLPVAFKKADEILAKLLAEHKPDISIHLGLAGGRSSISLERVAINLMDARIPDNENYQPKDEQIRKDGETAYLSILPIKEIVNELRKEGIPSVVSNTAGMYVCNEVMYLSLYHSAKFGLPLKTGFIHVPYLPEQVVEKFLPNGQNIPCLPLDLQVKAVKIAIQKTIAFIS